MAPRKPNIPSKKRKRKFKKTSPPPRLSTAQIRRLTVDGEAVTDAPFVPDVLRSGRFKNVELGMKDMPAGYQEGGAMKTPKVLPKPKPKTSTNKKTGATRGAGDDKEYMRKAARANMNKGGGLNAAIERVKKTQGMQKGGTVPKKENVKEFYRLWTLRLQNLSVNLLLIPLTGKELKKHLGYQVCQRIKFFVNL